MRPTVWACFLLSLYRFSPTVSMLSGSHRPKVDLIIENHAGTNSNSAIQLSAAVQDCNIYYFEEPNTPVFYNNKYVKG